MGAVVGLLVAARHPQLVATLTLLAPAMPDLRMDPRRLSDPRMARLCFADPSAVASSRWAAAVQECGERTSLSWAVAALSRGRLLVLPRTGHVPQIERPTSVARAILSMIDAVDRAAW